MLYIALVMSCSSDYSLLKFDFGNIQFIDDATFPFPEAVVITVSCAVGVIVVLLLVGALLGYIVVVKKILSRFVTGSKQTTDMEGLASSVLISNHYHQ